MAPRSSSLDLAISFRTIAKRVGIVLLFALAILFFVMQKSENETLKNMNAGVIEFMAPVIDGLSEPFASIASSWVGIGQLFHVYEENERLREENQALLEWQQLAKQLQEENASLRSIAKYPVSENNHLITGKVTATEGGPYTKAVLINIGAVDEVKQHQPVVNEKGLVGRVITVHDTTSWVLLLQDINSRIPVRNERTGERAILVGGKGSGLRLRFLQEEHAFDVGDRLVSAGDGDVLPSDLPVGEVTHAKGMMVEAESYMVPHLLTYVQVLDHQVMRVPLDKKVNQ